VIREKTTETEVLASNLGSDRIVMDIDLDDPAALAHLSDVLSGQYHDETDAAIREYSTNAYDSHVERGHGAGYNPARPIEVMLPCSPYEMPTEAKPRSLRIRDYGVGLSVEEISEVYSRYAKSTKTRTNDQQGLFGIGSKVGLVKTFGTYKVTSIKDGQKAVVVAGRDEEGLPVMDLVYGPAPTDEPQGVEIELPVHDRYAYDGIARRARNLFQFWPEGSVLVDGKEPEKLKPKVKVTDDMWIVEGTSIRGGNNIIVMGNVPYPVELDTKLAKNHSVVFWVPIGSVMPAPSREALRMSPDTKQELSRLLAEYDREVAEAIQTRVNEAATKAEAVKAALKWRSVFASKADLEVNWRGMEVPMRFKPAKNQTILVTEHEANKLSKHSYEDEIFVGTLVDAVLVHGYTNTNFNANTKKKLEKWARLNNLKPRHYVLTNSKLAHGWIDSSMRADWDTDIKPIKLATNKPGSSGRIRGSYDVFKDGRWHIGMPADQIDTSELFWITPNEFSEKDTTRGRWMARREAERHNARMERRRSTVTDRYPNATFVELPSNRIEKFLRDFPMARTVDEVFTEIWTEFKVGIKKADLVRLKIADDGNVGLLRVLDPNKVKDPQLATAIRQTKRKVNVELKDGLKRMRSLVGAFVVDSDKDLTVKWVNPLDKYPLASSHNIEHTYIYINAVYAAKGQYKS
jgi:hypothetical protein